MKFRTGLFAIVCSLAILSCNSSSTDATEGADSTSTSQPKDSVVNTGSTAGFKLGVQMWTFRMFPLADALNKVDSAGIKHIEAFLDRN